MFGGCKGDSSSDETSDTSSVSDVATQRMLYGESEYIESFFLGNRMQ
jgi:hypothetical protein